MIHQLSPELEAAYLRARDTLLAERNAAGHWEGELSTSALSTATAVVALELVRRSGAGHLDKDRIRRLIDGGLGWLAAHQNDDGGWGDTVKSVSNISTSMLAHAAFFAAAAAEDFRSTVDRAAGYIARVGGMEAVLRRYGKDRTFSIPILTHCALAGTVEWKHVLPLPFELACVPARFYKTVRLPVVSYALPALIAIGQVRHHHHRPRNPLTRLVRHLAVEPSLRILERIQPVNGGFLEATPLTSFVTMSLAGMGRAGHPVARRGVEFIANSVRPDGSWPIDTNLATWVTTLSVNALGDDLPSHAREGIRQWLIGQQYRDVHPYTNADPGGWAWTDLPGGVPDADDTPGAVLAVLGLSELVNSAVPSDTANASICCQGGLETESRHEQASDGKRPAIRTGIHLAKAGGDTAVRTAVQWLLDLQNRDGGWPTFCRGWGALPFDRSAPDLTAHAVRAISAAMPHCGDQKRARNAVERGFRYLRHHQRADGSWLPLWFGNQFAPADENPTYGTARVLLAYRDCGLLQSEPAVRGEDWLRVNQNDDGGWGGVRGAPSSVEETALAVEALVASDPYSESTRDGLRWLMEAVDSGRYLEPSPIGFYFAKLWYFERLYPLIFTVSALRSAVQRRNKQSKTESARPDLTRLSNPTV